MCEQAQSDPGLVTQVVVSVVFNSFAAAPTSSLLMLWVLEEPGFSIRLERSVGECLEPGIHPSVPQLPHPESGHKKMCSLMHSVNEHSLDACSHSLWVSRPVGESQTTQK